MRKISLIVAAALALTMASCGNKSDSANSATDSTMTDSAAVSDSTAGAADDSTLTTVEAGDAKAAPMSAAALTKEIQAKIASKDAQGLTTLLSNARAKITELAKSNPAQAKAYVSQLQQYVAQHAAEIKAMAKGNATINQAVDEVKNLDPEKVVNAVVASAKADAKNAGEAITSTTKGAAQEAVNKKVDEASSAVKSARETADKKVNDAVNKANKKANDAVNKANKKANDAVNKATQKALNGLGL